MKKIIYISICFTLLSINFMYAQSVASIEIKCPPCRPVMGCDQCFENQTAANEACNSSSARFIDLENEIKDLNLNIYPNPSASGVFTITSDQKLIGQIKVFNPLGSLISQFDIQEVNKLQYGKEMNLPTGIYILVFTDVNGKSISKRMVVDY
ncbi:T9SS type A sorting domain-containing protein [Flammeovirga sp. MY04]|uniref:T9SS type A sorting domain-containing protein n=1 Tax=Flammeovirga sp. MY04 TaxID=1191459 RepID=UPI000A01B2DF|nr:T9SS type A sorting domain-containing protein [Flammeovirga sp. MY04]ANQ49961.2 T9SS type A sorting domain-containing protein [Flammeovirga sp. MY04]